jgi:hypothetical protein
MAFNISLKTGEPIAIIEGGNHNGEIIHINNNEDTNNFKNTNDMNILARDFFPQLKGRIGVRQLENLYEAINTGKRPLDTKVSSLYDSAKNMLECQKHKEVILEDGNMRPLFNINKERQVYYVTGMSGSGKSTYAGQLADAYHKLYPQNPIYLFSNKLSDQSLDKYKFINRLKLDNSFIDTPLTLDEISNSLIIFDDVENVPYKPLEKELDRIKDLILTQGRDRHVSFIYISHLANDYKRTRLILNEANCTTVFPQHCSQYSLKYLLEKYFGFSKNDVKKLYGLNSRWVSVYTAPLFVLHQKGGYLLH